METQLKASDNILKELLGERRKEVQSLQKHQTDLQRDIEVRGQQRITALMSTLNKENADLLQKLNKGHAEQETKSASALLDSRKKHASVQRSTIATEKIPGEREGYEGKEMHESAKGAATAHTIGWKTPYYGTLHGSDGTIYWQGYNPGNIDLWDTASGSGSGLFGTGAASFTAYMDWWFSYTTDTSRFYNNAIYVPFHGFDIVHADDGFWDSKEAHVRIDLAAMGYQYNGKPTANANVFDVDSQNINVNDRYDGWRTMNYADLLGGGDAAYLRVSASFYVYARGGGSFAELNFSDGAANYLGVPVVYVN
jgi:hypothetical protein